MSSVRKPSPARSLGAPETARRRSSRGTRSVGSPARSTASGRLSSIILMKETQKNSFILSPMPTRRSVLNDNTAIEEPRRKSWWKNLGDNSRDMMEVLQDNKILGNNDAVEELMDIEVLSQEKKNYTLDLPDSSDNESINSIVLPQRKLFTQKENHPQNKYSQLIENRESLAMLHRTGGNDKTLHVAPKNLFNQNAKQKSKPVFPAALLQLSSNKTMDKTKEGPAEVQGQVRNLFAARLGTKRKNMFADFIVSESEDEISEIQPRVFGFQNQLVSKRNSSTSNSRHDTSHASSITTDIEDDWKQLPSSTMVENQIESMMVGAKTPAKKPRLSKFSEAIESGSTTTQTFNSSIRQKQDKMPSVRNESRKFNLDLEKQNDNQGNLLEKSGDVIVEISKRHSKLPDSDENLEQLHYDSTGESEKNGDNENKQPNDYDVSGRIESIVPNDHVTELDQKSEEHSMGDHEEEVQESEEEITQQDLKDTQDKEENRDKVEESQKSADVDSIEEEDNISETSQEDHQEEDKMADNSQEGNQIEEESQAEVENRVELVATKKAENLKNIKSQAEAVDVQEADNYKKSIVSLDMEPVLQEAEPVIQNGEPFDLQKLKESTQKKYEIIRKMEENVNLYENMESQEGKDLEDEKIVEESHEKEEKLQDQVLEEMQLDTDNEEAQEGEEIQSDHDEVDNQDDPERHECDDEKNKLDSDSKCEIQVQNILDEVIHGVQEVDVQEELEAQENSDVEMRLDISNEKEEEIHNNKTLEEETHSDQEIDDQEESEAQVSSDEEVQDEEMGEEEEIQESAEISQLDNSAQASDAELANSSQEETDNEEEFDDHEENNEGVEDNNEDEIENQEIEESNELEQESTEEIEDTNDDNEQEGEDTAGSEEQETDNQETSFVPHFMKGGGKVIHSPEAIMYNKSKIIDSFNAKRRNTSLRRSSIMKSMNLRPSLAPPRESTGLSDGTTNSSVEGSGWDSHRTTRKTLRQTFGKDFSPRKSLRALVMEKSANRQTAINDLTSVTSKFPQANSTELPESSRVHDDNDENEPTHAISPRTRQTTLINCLQKIKKDNLERKMKMEEYVRNSLKAPIRDISNTFKVPTKPVTIRKQNMKLQSKPKPVKTTFIPLDDLPPEVLEDMKYKPPKRFRPSNAAWITNRLYKYLESKLEPRYNYKSRRCSEKLVEKIYQFAKELRRHEVASSDAVKMLKLEMATLDIVKTHFDFYQFFHDFMPREIRIKVVPDIVNKIPTPRNGIFSDILRGNQG